MTREFIRKKVRQLISTYETNDPRKLCEYLNVIQLEHDLGSDIMGYRLEHKQSCFIVLNSRMSDYLKYITCCHELGHQICDHSSNTEFLKHSDLTYASQGNEYEANVFMVELLTYNVNAACFSNEEQLLQICNVPKWAKRYVDWDYIRSEADFSSFDSIY